MIEFMILAAQLQMKYEMEAEERWRERFAQADPEMKKIMLEQKEKDRLEKIAERRHQEQIRAQEKIADAIRSSSFWRF